MPAKSDVRLMVVPSEPDSDEALLLSMAREDRSAFQSLAVRYAERLARFCDKQTGFEGHGDDLAQDVLVAAWNARSRFTGGDGAAWLFTLAINRCRKHRRSVFRLFSARSRIRSVPESAATSPDDALAQHQLSQHARAALNELPDDLRETVLLRIDGELDYRSIGQVVGCTEGAARVRVFTAIRRLRAAMEAHV